MCSVTGNVSEVFFSNFFFLFFAAILTLPTIEITGFAGENITLSSGAPPQETLSKIEWSIFKNTTYIARYAYGVLSVNLFPPYRDRLGLNKVTGEDRYNYRESYLFYFLSLRFLIGVSFN